jgi:preprotein translocase subunit SecY
VLSTIFNAFRVADIRKKLAFTAMVLALYRLGSFIPVPGVNTEAIEQIEENYAGSNILGCSTPSRAAASPGSRSSRSGSCRTSRPRSSCSS